MYMDSFPKSSFSDGRWTLSWPPSHTSGSPDLENLFWGSNVDIVSQLILRVRIQAPNAAATRVHFLKSVVVIRLIVISLAWISSSSRLPRFSISLPPADVQTV